MEKDGIVRFAQWQHPKCRPTRFDQGSVDELRNYLLPGDAVIDIGAHCGDTSVLFALAVGETRMVFAVEPNRYVLAILEKNATLNAQVRTLWQQKLSGLIEQHRIGVEKDKEIFFRDLFNLGDREHLVGRRHIGKLSIEFAGVMTHIKGCKCRDRVAVKGLRSACLDGVNRTIRQRAAKAPDRFRQEAGLRFQPSWLDAENEGERVPRRSIETLFATNHSACRAGASNCNPLAGVSDLLFQIAAHALALVVAHQ